MLRLNTSSFPHLNRCMTSIARRRCNRKSYGALHMPGKPRTCAIKVLLSCEQAYSLSMRHQHFYSVGGRGISSNCSGNNSNSSNCIRSSAEDVVKKRIFDEHLKFPLEFMIKVVGLNETSLVEHVVKSASSNLGPQDKELEPLLKETANGKYVSITIKPFVRSAEELYKLYAAVQADSRVKFVL